MTLIYSLLADGILVLHGLIVFFNLAALPATWLGYFCGWTFARNFSFRITHLALIAFISIENALGTICPLTTWENHLRVKAGLNPRYQGTFVAHWLHRLIFYDCDQKVFAIGYGIFLGLVLLTLFFIRPRPPGWWRKKSPLSP
jgi:Protein of Unknown function (DUF2784)